MNVGAIGAELDQAPPQGGEAPLEAGGAPPMPQMGAGDGSERSQDPGGMSQGPPAMSVDPGALQALQAAIDNTQVQATAAQEALEAIQAGMQVVDYTVDMSEDELADLGRIIWEELERYRTATQKRRALMVQWRRAYELMPTSSSGRWRNSAQHCSSISRRYSNAHTSKINGLISSFDPPFSADCRSEAAAQLATTIEEVIADKLEEYDFIQAMVATHDEAVPFGNCFVRLTWEEDICRRPYHEYDVDQKVYDAALAQGMGAGEAFALALKRDRQGRAKVKLKWKTENQGGRPEFKVIPWEDGFLLPAGIRDPKHARAKGEFLRMTGSELRRGATIGTYRKEAVERILEFQAATEREDRGERLDMTGQETNPDYEPVDRNPLFRSYEVAEMTYLMDIDGDGLEEMVIIGTEKETREIYRIQALMYDHGESTYHLVRFNDRVSELWGQGDCELLASHQAIDTAVWNQLVDSADLALGMRGNFWYDLKSGFDPSKYIIQLGVPVGVKDVEGIKPMVWEPLSPEHYALRDQIKSDADLLTNTSDISFGKHMDVERTLGEVQIADQNSAQAFSEKAARMIMQWSKIIRQFRLIIAQYAENGMVSYRRRQSPGAISDQIVQQGGPENMMTPIDPGFDYKAIPARILREDVHLVPTGLKALADRQSRMQQATVILRELQSNPLTQTNPAVQYLALDSWLQEVGAPRRDTIMTMTRLYLGMAAADAGLEGGMMDLAQLLMGQQRGTSAAGAEAQAGEDRQFQKQSNQLGLDQQRQQMAQDRNAAQAQPAGKPASKPKAAGK